MNGELEVYILSADFSPFYRFFFQGKGGNAGRLNIRYRKLNGQVQIRSCRGSGAQPAKNGQGGQGERTSCFWCLSPINSR